MTKTFKEFEDFFHRQHIKQELSKTKKKAKSNDAKWLSEDEFWNDF